MDALLDQHGLGERASVIYRRGHSVLYLGDRIAATTLPQVYDGALAVVNCAPAQVSRSPLVTRYMEVNVNDAPTVCASGGGSGANTSLSFDSLAGHFERTERFINTALDEGCSVLVHCAGGISRSATVVIAFVLQQERTSLADAMSRVTLARPVIGPNAGFFNELVSLEERLMGQTSMERALNANQRVYRRKTGWDNK